MVTFATPRKYFFFTPAALIVVLLIFSLAASSVTLGQSRPAFVRLIRKMEAEETGVSSPFGLAFSPQAGSFYVVEAPSEMELREEQEPAETDIVELTSYGERQDMARISAAVEDPLNITYDGRGQRLLIFVLSAGEVVEIPENPDGTLDPKRMHRHDVSHVGLKNPQGMAVDPTTGHLFVLDGVGPRIVRIEPGPDGSFYQAETSVINLQSRDLNAARGLAFDVSSGHLHVINPSGQKLYELTQGGQVMAFRDLTGIGLVDPQGMAFAPSSDLTDDASTINLFVADSGLKVQSVQAALAGQGTGSIVELSFVEPPSLTADITQASLLQTIDTSLFITPSPDPAGIAYLPAQGTLLAADSEVNELPIFTGDNLFDITLSGILSDTLTTIPFSDEPTGVTVNPANNHLFISDDTGAKSIYELNPGPDGKYDTPDDIVTSFSTSDFGSRDPEGVAFEPGQGVLYIVDGVNREVYRVDPGSNGVFDGVAPDGDDQVSSFDTASLGIIDPEGIVFDEVSGHLYIVGVPITVVAHITTDGELVRVIDISTAMPVNPAGLTIGPTSPFGLASGTTTIFIADRGIDNGEDPDENDGKVFEMAIPHLTPGNMPPQVNAGPDQNVTLPDSATLDGTLVSDDGLPVAAITEWSQASGPGTVIFADPGALDTTASFSLPGAYTLRLTAEDSELSGSDEVTVIVTGDPGVAVVDIRIEGTDTSNPDLSSDDAEEEDSPTTGLKLYSSDIDMLYDRSGDDMNEIVGMRFNLVSIPQGAFITNSFVQFQVEDASYINTSLIVQGEAADNPGTFSLFNKISTRQATTAQVPWSPPPWPFVGEAGAYQRTPNIASIVQEIVDRPGWESGNSLVIMIDGTGERVASAYEKDPAKAPVLHVEYRVNQPPSVDAGPDQPVTLPGPAVLDGTVTDDGLPGPVTTTWSKVSGPGAVSFADASSVDTAAAFSEIGNYVLRLTADDGELTSSDELAIMVTAEAEPPEFALFLPITQK